MILENYAHAGTAPSEGDQLTAHPGMTGDAVELVEFANEYMTDVHNLTIALARFEHKCFTESAGAEVLNEGIADFFKRVGQKIAEYWKRFIAWLGTTVENLRMKVFGPRESWLKENEAALKAAKSFKDVKVSLGEQVLTSKLDSMFTEAKSKGLEVVNKIKSMTPEQAAEMQKEGFWKRRKANATLASELEEELIGTTKEMPVDAGLVGKLIPLAHRLFRNVDLLAAAKQLAEAAMKEAQGWETYNAAGGDNEAANARVKALSAIGPQIQTLFTALTGINAKANGQVMSALVKAKSAIEGEKKEAEVKKETTGVLDAYLV